MKHKLIKYIKIIIAITLIGALTLPSYAAVNAADGSAFVTKAEFDAALSDFNARLTTFEAGINSKIDSQVSSYLDRNGIWNGKIQQYSGGGTSKVLTVKASNWATKSEFAVSDYNILNLTPWGREDASNGLTNVTWTAGGTKFVKLVIKDHFIELMTANKSGLVNLNWQVQPEATIGWYGPGFASWTGGWTVSTYEGKQYLFSNNNTTYTTDPTIWVKDKSDVKRTAIRHSGFGVNIDQSTAFRTWIGLKWLGTFGDTPTFSHWRVASSQFSVDLSPFNFQDYFFVAKGEKIGFGFNVNIASVNAFIADSRYVGTDFTWCKATFNECKIY